MPAKRDKTSKESHVSKGNVFDELGFSKKVGAVVKMKSDLLNKVISIVEKRKYTPRQLEKLLDQPQPRISELLNGKISKLSIDRLLEYLECLGGEVSIRVKLKKASWWKRGIRSPVNG
jgi:predicted XRE-type DNA-binding protein